MIIWVIKSFVVGALALCLTVGIAMGYIKLEDFLTSKFGNDAMKTFWAFIIASIILGVPILAYIQGVR